MLKRDTGLAPAWFTPNEKADSAVRFLLRPLTGGQMIELSDQYITSGNGAVLRPRGTMLAARYAVSGWENWIEASGAPVAFSDAMIGSIPWEFLLQIGAEVVNRNTMRDDERKNS